MHCAQTSPTFSVSTASDLHHVENAVRLAVPMLAKASAVHIVTVTEDASGFPATDACEYLARHGICAELHQQERSETTLASA